MHSTSSQRRSFASLRACQPSPIDYRIARLERAVAALTQRHNRNIALGLIDIIEEVLLDPDGGEITLGPTDLEVTLAALRAVHIDTDAA